MIFKKQIVTKFALSPLFENSIMAKYDEEIVGTPFFPQKTDATSTSVLRSHSDPLTGYKVNTGMLNPFSFNFTNCSCTSRSKRCRSCVRGDWRVIFPLPKRVAKPCLRDPKNPWDPKWPCGSCVTYSLKHVKSALSSPIGSLHRKYRYLIVFISKIRLFYGSI